METKHQLLNATILLRCEKSNHDNCVELLQEVLNMKNVVYAETANAIVDTEEFCVLADAAVNASDIKKFQGQLDGLVQSGKAHKTALFINQ